MFRGIKLESPSVEGGTKRIRILPRLFDQVSIRTSLACTAPCFDHPRVVRMRIARNYVISRAYNHLPTTQSFQLWASPSLNHPSLVACCVFAQLFKFPVADCLHLPPTPSSFPLFFRGTIKPVTRYDYVTLDGEGRTRGGSILSLCTFISRLFSIPSKYFQRFLQRIVRLPSRRTVSSRQIGDDFCVCFFFFQR